MSDNSYLAQLRATLVTETRRIGLVESERMEALNLKRCKQKKFWRRMFLATTLIASNPFHVSVVHGSVRPAQTQWNTETSTLALGIFTTEVANRAQTKLVQVADRSGKGGGNGGGNKGSRGGSEGRSGGNDDGGGKGTNDGNHENSGGNSRNEGRQVDNPEPETGKGKPDDTHPTDRHGDHNEDTAGGDGETGEPNPGGVVHTDDSTETPHGDLDQADPQAQKAAQLHAHFLLTVVEKRLAHITGIDTPAQRQFAGTDSGSGEGCLDALLDLSPLLPIPRCDFYPAHSGYVGGV